MKSIGVCRALVWCLIPAGAPLCAQPFTVATVGDSFADSLYQAMRARPDLLQRYGVRLERWSRPIVGLTRTDYFDYAGWLRHAPELGSADLCLVEIGANDMQSIPIGPRQWIPYGSPQWRESYAGRAHEMAKTLADRLCGQVLWVLQPGFEKREAMACHRELINEVQGAAVREVRTRMLEFVTSDAAYGPDKTHFNRAYVLELGPSLFHLVDTARQIVHMRCLGCHQNAEVLPRAAEIFPLQWRVGDPAAPLWAPDRVGMQCRVPVVRLAKVRRPGRSRRRGA